MPHDVALTLSLDDAITQALGSIRSAGTPDPDLLLFAATGTAGLVAALDGGVKLELRDVDGVPSAFHGRALYAGTMGPTTVWIVEDAPRPCADAPSWTPAFPVWLASAAGAAFIVHTSAGTGLNRPAGDGSLTAESLVRAQDHINLSGTTPLLGLGQSRLGPLFPDQTRVHDKALAAVAHKVATDLGLDLKQTIAACTLGPALATPAELRSYATAGAGLAVQRLADPLIAAAHAGLRALALSAVTDIEGETLGMADLVARATRVAPSLDRLVIQIARDAGPLIAAQREETPA